VENRSKVIQCICVHELSGLKDGEESEEKVLDQLFICPCRATDTGVTRRGPRPTTPATINNLFHRGGLYRASACGATKCYSRATWAGVTKRVRIAKFIFLRLFFKYCLKRIKNKKKSPCEPYGRPWAHCRALPRPIPRQAYWTRTPCDRVRQAGFMLRLALQK
jgi:hypothetical protein